MVDASLGAVPREPGSPATPAGGRRQQARPWRPQRFAAPRSRAKPRRRGRLRALRGTRPVAEAVLLSGARRRAGGGSRRGAAERWLREAARSRRGAAHHLPPGRRLPARRAWSALRGCLGRAPAEGPQAGREASVGARGHSAERRRRGPRSALLGGPLLTPARGEPRGGRRKRSRRPLLPPLEPGAPAGEAGEVVPRDFWAAGARAGAAGRTWGAAASRRRGASEGSGGNLKAAARSRITAALDRGQHNKFQESSSLLPSLPKSSGSGSGARRVAEGYVAALHRARVRARAPNSWHAEERGRGWEL